MLVRVVWDEPKRQANLAKHRLDFADIDDGFDWENALFQPAKPSRTGRRRLRVLGLLDGRLVSMIVSPLGTEALAIISLRRADADERKDYDAR